MPLASGWEGGVLPGSSYFYLTLFLLLLFLASSNGYPVSVTVELMNHVVPGWKAGLSLLHVGNLCQSGTTKSHQYLARKSPCRVPSLVPRSVTLLYSH